MEASGEFGEGPRGPQQPAEPQADEAALWRDFAGEGAAVARERLFSAYFPFARQIAGRHFRDRGRGDIEFAELCQLASAGLLEAIDRFDPSLGVPFKAYAARRISGSILDGLAKMSELREQLSFRNRVRTERARSLSVEDAEAMPAADAMQALADLAVGLALGFMLDGTGGLVGDGERSVEPNAYDSLVWKDTVRRLASEVSALPERERLVIRHHYLNGLSFDRIGDLLGLSKGRISQLHRAALGLLQKRLRNAGDFRLER